MLPLVTCCYWLLIDVLVVDMYTETNNTSVASLLEEKYSKGEPPLPGDVMLLWLLVVWLLLSLT